MDIVIERGGLRDATASEYHNKAMLLDVMHADPQVVGHMHAGSTDRDGVDLRRASAATTFGRSKCLSTSAGTNLPPSKLWARRKGKQRPN